jgi:hypothetical protein
MGLSTCLTWKNRRVLLLGKAGVIGKGEIVHVDLSLHPDDIDLAICLMDGSVTWVLASDQSRTWEFADASDRPAA